MKRFITVLLLFAACCFLNACERAGAPSPSPSASYTAIATPSVSPSPVPTNDEEYDYKDAEAFHAAMKDLYSYVIEEADKCRVNVDGTEYFLDTDKLVEMDIVPEFPLYRIRSGDSPEYLGTTGFAFQVFGDYIYIQSDPLQEDYPDGTLTRVVNLNDLSVTQFDRNVSIFTPRQGSSVYYTYAIDDNIYIAEPSLKKAKKLHIELPDQETIKEKTSEYKYDVCEDIYVTDVKDGWIYFEYDLFTYEGGILYEGNYRIKTDGNGIDKTDEGQFGEDNG